MNCQSCGLPMMIDSDHGGGRADNQYCKYCTDAAGNLKPRVEIREGMINLYMQSFGKTREEAEKEVDLRMAQMPAWQGSSAPAPSPEPVSPLVSQPTPPAAEPVVPEQPATSLPTEPLTAPAAPSPLEPSPAPAVQEPASLSVEEQPLTPTGSPSVEPPVQAPVAPLGQPPAPSATEPPGQDTGADEKPV